MTGGKGSRPPPSSTRFRKGTSGNPKGRPRSGPRVPASAFDVVIDRTLTVTQAGSPRELTVEEALQHKTYQDALAGSRAARREVLKWIEKRERWLAAKAPTKQSIGFHLDLTDPDNANRALLLLGIAEPDTRFTADDDQRRLRLQSWAVQIALSRRRGPLSTPEVAEIKLSTRDAEGLRWPAGTRHDRDD